MCVHIIYIHIYIYMYIYIYIHTLVHRLGHGFRWHFESYLCIDRAFVGLEVYVDYMGFCD